MAQRQISQCFDVAPRPVSLNDRRALLGLFAFAVVVILAVGHISLRFATRDMMMQHRQLQEKGTLLRRDEAALKHRNEVLCDPERLRNFARRDMAMVETDQRSQVTVALAADVRDRYLKASPEAGSAIARNDEQGRDGKGILMSIFDNRSAFAGQP
jgi:cell division protein FtsL